MIGRSIPPLSGDNADSLGITSLLPRAQRASSAESNSDMVVNTGFGLPAQHLDTVCGSGQRKLHQEYSIRLKFAMGRIQGRKPNKTRFIHPFPHEKDVEKGESSPIFHSFSGPNLRNALLWRV